MKKSSVFQVWGVLGAFTFLFAIASVRAQVANGGFETGTFAGWTVNDPSGFTNIGPDPLFAHSGTYHANLGATGLLGSLSQNVATIAGQQYTLSFWLANDGGGSPNEFDVLWNGSTLLALSNAAVQNYTLYSFNVTGGAGGSTPLEFRYRNDEDFFRLDDVSTTAVPEPATVWLLLSAGGVLGLAKLRRR